MRVGLALFAVWLLLPAPAHAEPEKNDPSNQSDQSDDSEQPEGQQVKGLQPPPPIVGEVLVAGVDLLVVRPLGAAATGVGALMFIPVAALTAANGMHNIEEAFELFVLTPYRETFERRIGDFD